MNSDFKVLYYDKDLITVIKPFGIISEDNEKNNCIFSYIRSFLQDNGEKSDIYQIHRLDKETGGIMVFARNKETAAFLSKAVAENKFTKIYTAEISGKITPESGEMTDLLFFDRKRNKSFTVKRERKGVKKAILFYETEEFKNERSIVKIKLGTGRTHQIRVQLSSRGFPITGDRKYGGEKADFMHLWAGELAFPAANGKILSFKQNADF